MTKNLHMFTFVQENKRKKMEGRTHFFWTVTKPRKAIARVAIPVRMRRVIQRPQSWRLYPVFISAPQRVINHTPWYLKPKRSTCLNQMYYIPSKSIWIHSQENHIYTSVYIHRNWSEPNRRDWETLKKTMMIMKNLIGFMNLNWNFILSFFLLSFKLVRVKLGIKRRLTK